jgi:hypothetical protein
MLTDYNQAYKERLFNNGAGPGNSPYWMPGGVFGGVPMGGGKRRRLRKSKKMLKRKSGKKQLRKTKKYSRK